MRFFYLIIFLPLLILSCGNPVENKTDSTAIADPFREAVMKMRHSGLITTIPDAKLDSVIAVFKKDSVNGLKELLVSSGDLLKIHVALNGRKLEDVYQKICDTIGMRYPELKTDEVQCSFLPDKVGGKDTEWVLIRLRFGKSWYERKLYYFKNWEVDDFVYRTYNRMLADSGKQERLHLVEFTCLDCAKKQDDFMGTTDVSQYGYLLLNKMQEDSLLQIDALQMEPENEFAVYTTSQMDAELKKFESTGLVDAVGQKWYDKVKTDIHQSSIYSQEDIYDFFDTLFCKAEFDTLNDFNPYQEVLDHMAKISRGKFNPTDISDEAATKTSHTVKFGFEGDVYQFDAEQKGGLYYPGIINNVNKALEDHKVGGAFYTVLTRGNVCMLIYLDDKDADKAKASGFFAEFTKGPSLEINQKYGISN
jgi:hypothetical protein